MDEKVILALFERCMQEGSATRKEQMAIPSPFADRSDITDVPVVCQEFYDGDHWRRFGILPTWKSLPVDNMCFQAVESNTTKLTDSRPRVGIVAREVNDQPTAKLLQAYQEYWWEQTKGSTALYLSVKDSRKFCLGWLHLEWSPSKQQQVLRSEHFESVTVDPDCTIDDFDPTWLVFEYVAQVGELKNRYPDADWANFQQKKTYTGWFERILKRFSGDTSVENPAKSIPVYEFYMKDTSTVEFDVPTEEWTVRARKKKFPNGRKFIIAGGILLNPKEDDQHNVYKHGKFGFVPIPAYPETGKMYGQGDVARLIPQQIILNRTDQYLFDATFKSTGGIFLVNKMMGLAKTSITNDPVQVREVKDVNAALRVVQPPSPPRHMFDMRALARKAGDDAVGIHDISRGAYTPGNKTVAEVNVMAESDNTRVRMAARFLGIAIEEIGRMWLSNVAQFEDKELIVRIAGDDGKPQSVGFNPAAALRTDVQLDENEAPIDWDLLPLDIRIADTSTLPARQQELAQQAMGLAQMQIIDPENLLEVLDWPDRKALLARQKAAQEEAMAMQAQQGAQMPPQDPNAPQEPSGEPTDPSMPPPEVIQSIEVLAQEMGVAPEDIMALLDQLSGWMNDTAYAGGRNPGMEPVPEMV